MVWVGLGQTRMARREAEAKWRAALRLRSPGLWAALLLVGLAASCGPRLPEPDSPGAILYRQRCSQCHRLFAPGSMTSATWEINLRMHVLGAKRGAKVALDREEERVLLEYLRRHAEGAS